MTRREPHRIPGALLAGVLLLVLLAGCPSGSTSTPRLELPLEPLPAVRTLPADSGPWSIGIPAWLAVDEMRTMHEPVARHLSETTGAPFRFRYGETYDDVIEDLVAGELDFAALPPYAYVVAAERLPGLTVLCTHVAGGSTHFRGYVVARAGAGFDGLADLAGGTVAFVDPRSTSGHLYPAELLREAGVEPDVRWAGSHDRALALLREGAVDAAAVWGGALDPTAEHPGTRDLVILARTPPIPNDAWVAHPDTPDRAREALRTALLRLSTATREGREVLTGTTIQGWVRGDDEAFEPVRAARARHEVRSPTGDG